MKKIVIIFVWHLQLQTKTKLLWYIRKTLYLTKSFFWTKYRNYDQLIKACNQLPTTCSETVNIVWYPQHSANQYGLYDIFGEFVTYYCTLETKDGDQWNLSSLTFFCHYFVLKCRREIYRFMSEPTVNTSSMPPLPSAI